MLDRITPLILTWNEAPNIGRALSRLQWAKRIVVVDSGSDDGTQEIVAGFPNAVLLSRPFDSHAEQWNFGLRSPLVETDWVIALDADYILAEAMPAELERLRPSEACAGYMASFRYCIDGRPLRGSLYPPVTVLFRRAGASFVQDGHTQRVRVSGTLESLRVPIDHDDRKPLARWLQSQSRYADLEVLRLASTSPDELRWPDRLRQLVFFAPWLAPLYALLIKGVILDGAAGWHYALQRGVAEAILSMKLVERAWKDETPPR